VLAAERVAQRDLARDQLAMELAHGRRPGLVQVVGGAGGGRRAQFGADRQRGQRGANAARPRLDFVNRRFDLHCVAN
jgi:hypothetical protein